MPSRSIQRIATPDERTILEQWHAEAPTTMTRFKQGMGNSLVYWAISMFTILILWLVADGIAGKLSGEHFGFRGPAAAWMLAIGAIVSAVFAVTSSVRWLRNARDVRPLLRDDAHDAVVVEEHYTLTAAKRFQEPEHGGFLYFLRSAEDEVFTVFDHESQDLGVNGKDPLQSTFRPRTGLLVVRAARSGFVLRTLWSGDVIAVEHDGDLAADPADWPESDTLCDIPWSALEVRLGNHARQASS